MDWKTVLRTQQADFIQRLKFSHLLHCETEGQHSELIVISGERLKQLRNFCWKMADKYKRMSPVRDVFINNMKGKLGEEVVKARLSVLVTEVDYEKRISGDGKVDFTLTSDPSVGIQVKARYGSIDTVRWSISSEEVEKNAVLVCVLIQEELSEAQAEYHLILAGFLPTQLIKDSGQPSFKIDELLYGGGLRSYLENLDSLQANSVRIPIPKIRQEDEQAFEQIQAMISQAYSYLSLGIAHYKEEKYERAIEDFNEAIRLHPKMASAYNARGIARIQLQDHQGAIQDYNQALQLIPECTAIFYKNRGDVHYWINNKQGAIKDYIEALRLNPNFAEAYFQRGNLHNEIGDEQCAIEDYTQAIRINPNFAEAFLWRGFTREQMGDKQGAIKDYTEITRINPNDALAYSLRGNLLYEIGDKQSAIVAFKKAADIYQQQGKQVDFQEALHIIRELQK